MLINNDSLILQGERRFFLHDINSYITTINILNFIYFIFYNG